MRAHPMQHCGAPCLEKLDAIGYPSAIYDLRVRHQVGPSLDRRPEICRSLEWLQVWELSVQVTRDV
jgi:hypothetical protein